LIYKNKLLSYIYIIFTNFRPMSTMCQHFYFTVGGMFYKNVGISLGGCLTVKN